MPAIAITRSETGGNGRYAATIEGSAGEAELTYRRRAPNLVVANHTFAPPSMRGTGVARALVERLVADARAEGFTIVPTCSYVAAEAKRHPEWADVMRIAD